MAGRVGILTLETMSPLEILGMGSQIGWLENYLKKPLGILETPFTLFDFNKTYNEVIWRGSYPAAQPMPNSLIPSFFESYLQTYIQKDVRTLENIDQLQEFDRFLSLLSVLSGQEINFSQLGREIGIAAPKNLIISIND